MATSPPLNGPSTTSVFHALGSYADRIKDANGKPITSPPSGITPSLPTPTISASSKTPSPNPRTHKSTSAPRPAAPPTKQELTEEEGSWETVQSNRQKGKQEEKRSGANTSKNWRERPQRESKEKEKVEQREDAAKGKGKGKKGNTPNATPALTSERSTSSRPSVTPTSTLSSKPAWGLSTPATAAPTSHLTPSPALSTTIQTPQTANKHQSIPSSPSLNGTTPASAGDSTASPSLSAEIASTTTVATSAVTKPEDQDESRHPGSTTQETSSNAPAKAKAVSRPVAPPPTVNPWDVRKKALSAVTQSNGTAPPTSQNSGPKPGQAGPVMKFGSVQASSHSQVPNGNENHDELAKTNIVRRKKKTSSEAAPVVAPLADPTAWPDVATAAEVAKKEDDKKEKLKEKKGSDEGSVVEENGIAGKKTKWTAIPASELLAAADEIAESTRRANATRKRLAKAEASSSMPPPNRGKPRKASLERTRIQQGTGEIRLPPVPAVSNTVRGGAPAFKPVFGSVRTGSESENATEDGKDIQATSSTPLSRQTSQTSISRKGGSPSQHRSSLPTSPSSHAFDLTSPLNRAGSGPFSKPMGGSATAPVMQTPFHPTGSGTQSLPRVPRGRDPRGSFSARGRGGFRSHSHNVKGFTSPILQQNGLPDPNNMYARGYGMGYTSAFYPQAQQLPNQQQLAPAGAIDGNQAGYMGMYARPPPPPPPMPFTYAPNLDPLRFYVLGQVEYYFSMQNLAMDFFLRQQMDSEGWIDIPMIASFNRLKSLCSDVDIVKETMQLSSILEVRENKVRLAGEGSNRWVLPDAKLSTMPPEPNPPSDQPPVATNGLVNGVSENAEQSSDISYAMQGLGMEEGSAVVPKYAPGDVENALMKSVPPSSSASILNGENDGEGEGTGTPATSMSGEKDDDEADKVEAS